jgi:hypothetical protein
LSQPKKSKWSINLVKLGAGGQMFKGPWGVSVSRNITPHENGLKNWSNQEISKAIQLGVDRSGQHYKPPMAFDWYKNITENDIVAIVTY